jgi:hypothetical protein
MGQCYSEMSTIRKFLPPGNREWIERLAYASASTDPGCKFYIENDTPMMEWEKSQQMHLSHIAAFVTACVRTTILDQMMRMDPNDIVRVAVDAIKFVRNGTPFEYDHSVFKKFFDPSYVEGLPGDTWLSQYYDDAIPLSTAMPRDNFRTECHIGQGGGGKTQFNLTDHGLVKVLYVTHAWRLVREKVKEFCVSGQVIANLIAPNPDKWNEYYKRFNVIICDEVSMYTKEDQQLILSRYDRFGREIPAGPHRHCLTSAGVTFEPCGSLIARIRCARARPGVASIRLYLTRLPGSVVPEPGLALRQSAFTQPDCPDPLCPSPVWCCVNPPLPDLIARIRCATSPVWCCVNPFYLT